MSAESHVAVNETSSLIKLSPASMQRVLAKQAAHCILISLIMYISSYNLAFLFAILKLAFGLFASGWWLCFIPLCLGSVGLFLFQYKAVKIARTMWVDLTCAGSSIISAERYVPTPIVRPIIQLVIFSATTLFFMLASQVLLFWGAYVSQ
jgi:hypothetical protein